MQVAQQNTIDLVLLEYKDFPKKRDIANKADAASK